MTIPFTKRISVPSDVLVQEVEGEAVLLNVNSGRYFGLDEVGNRMWVALTTSDTIQAGYETLLAEYEVEEDRLRRDMHELIEKLLEQGLVRVDEN